METSKLAAKKHLGAIQSQLGGELQRVLSEARKKQDTRRIFLVADCAERRECPDLAASATSAVAAFIEAWKEMDTKTLPQPKVETCRDDAKEMHRAQELE